MEVEGFENKGNLNGTDIQYYVHKTAYELLPENLNVDYSGFLFRKLHITNYAPVRFRGRC
ncbi:MAG: hypothetical protein ACUVXA_17360 [Candidatus Jordarchaeum sp.]|uniref:hypothetical protein n=1 Tax=Candidatus Jordarchaeum sp. TaxID=2823881 RepID=UPI00404AD3C6